MLIHRSPLSGPSLPQELLGFTDLFLRLAGYLFGFTFGLQLGIIGNFPGDLLDLTFYFVKRPSALFLILDFMVFLLVAFSYMIQQRLSHVCRGNQQCFCSAFTHEGVIVLYYMATGYQDKGELQRKNGIRLQ